jgi:thioredoxin reductase
VDRILDYVIVGAGPAGLQMAYFLRKAGATFKVLERSGEVGSFFRQFPRHRRLLSINKVYTGVSDPEAQLRWDWNSLLSDEEGPLFRDFSRRYFPDAEDLVRYLKQFAIHHALEVELNTHVSLIERPGNFVVHAVDGRIWTSNQLIIATGVSEENIPGFPGAELCERYTTVSIDPEDFAGQRVLIVGKGNSAFETAENLVETAASIHVASPRPLRLAWRTHFVGDLRAINNNFLDTYQLKSQNAVIDGTIGSIRRENDEYAVDVHYAHAHGEVETIRYDRVILCAGFRLDGSIFSDDCKPAMTSCGRLPVQSSAWESENVPGLYFAGTLMQQRDYKKYMSGFIHGFRYNIRALSRILASRYHGTKWPRRLIDFSAPGLVEALLVQMNRSSAIWQQPGFLADAIRIDREGTRAEYLEEVPVDYVKDSVLGAGTVLLLTLEYGKSDAPDPFLIERVHREDIRRADQSTFLHPVVRWYEDGRFVAEHHVLEDLAAEWREPEHIEPLMSFLDTVLGVDAASPVRKFTTEFPSIGGWEHGGDRSDADAGSEASRGEDRAKNLA